MAHVAILLIEEVIHLSGHQQAIFRQLLTNNQSQRMERIDLSRARMQAALPGVASLEGKVQGQSGRGRHVGET